VAEAEAVGDCAQRSAAQVGLHDGGIAQAVLAAGG